MELLGRYSNWTNWTGLLEGIGQARQLRRAYGFTRRRVARRLTQGQLAELVAGYQAGARVYDLAERFKIHGQTVSVHLHRLGVKMRNQGLGEHQVDRAILLYEPGRSLTQIVKRYDLNAGMVWLALRARGVRIRDTHGRER